MTKTKEELFKGLEEARTQFNAYQGKAAIYVDFEDNTAWTEVFDLPVFHSENIIFLVTKDDLYGRNDRFGVERLNKILKAKAEKKAEGYDKDYLQDNDYFLDSFMNK
ncbi:hypothetical protein J2T13_000165 [Paenibacillus sp. DS2015]|uniref:hypothetical protein n=1 Tax=Paenibacillus sp. DS2015 TaxID=3373917 RepID=UPI003D2624B7